MTTPVECRDGLWWKRDDLLIFPNGVSGKVRASMHLAEKAAAEGCHTLVYGGSVLAPAVGRVATAAHQVGTRCVIVLGGTLPDTAIRHENVAVAVAAGAILDIGPVGYNPALQRRAAALAALPGHRQIAYGITTPPDAAPDEVRKFLDVDAPEVDNLPDIETIVMPFGSGNTAAAILYGLTRRYKPRSLRRVMLLGVGPDRRRWLSQRLSYVGVDAFPFALDHVPLHPGFATYSDRMPETLDGIDLHPTYEGKIARWLNLNRPDWWRRDGSTLLWVVGGPIRRGGPQ